MNKVIFAILCALIFWLPIPLGSYRVWAIMFFGFVVSATFILHLVNCAHSKQAIFPDKSSWPLMGTLLAVISVLTIQLLPTSVQSIDPNQTFVMLLKTITMLMFAWLILLYVNNKERIKTLIYWLVAAGVCQALYALFLYFNPDLKSFVFQYEWNPRATGSFTYSNFLANYLGLCLSLGIGLYFTTFKNTNDSRSIMQKVRGLLNNLFTRALLIRFCLILIVIGILLTKSRMGNVAFFISLSFVSCMAFFLLKDKPKQFKVLLISFLVIDFAIFSALIGFDDLTNRLAETDFIKERRDEVYLITLNGIINKPLLGHGGGSFYTAFPQYKDIFFSGHYDNAHNDLLQFALEVGIPMTFILVLLVGWMFIKCICNMRIKASRFYHGVNIGIATALLYMSLHIFVDYPLQSGANGNTFIATLSLFILINRFRNKI
ncbi:hypothetical protein OM33_09995 [Pseudoalteromonas piratica]|uniref:O-antigen ligase-related domain-containing protein n=1 Tax=Pseudoalteromonas piratica TaxID=1348114 RepID=A0A0A7EK53_9GAMM|nr:hypothetical protein OM33_09995 [Pseudoalteromonas piratica]